MAAMTRTDAASRLIAATPDRIFAAFTDPDELLAWLPPDGMTGTVEHFDLRTGGSYRLTLTYGDTSDGRGKTTTDSDVVEARFVEVVPDVRLVQQVDFVSDQPEFAGTMTMTWQLTAEEDGTRVEFRADDVPEGISAADHATGLRSSLANLAAHVERG
jgi:uncharacterized protein YndB with AHSA1/START domain